MKRIRRVIRNVIIFFFASTVLTVLLYRFIPVYVTPLMLIRCSQDIISGDKPDLYHRWVPLDDMSPWLPLAVIASEDNLFMEHSGFDFQQIKKAIEENKIRKKPRGASTISQQTAKNVFLWPGRSFLQKRIGSLFYVFNRTPMGKKAHYGSIFKFYRNWGKIYMGLKLLQNGILILLPKNYLVRNVPLLQLHYPILFGLIQQSHQLTC